MEFDERQFRDALSRFPTGVAVVTSVVDGVKIAMTVSSFNAVSLRPPLVLFSIARSAQSFDLWQQVETFAVMVLQEGQGALSTKFATPGGNKWHDVVVVPGVTGVPLLPTWLACFECNIYARYDGGDHEIVVGQVVALQHDSRQPLEPLVFYGGRYRVLRTDSGYGTGPGDIWLHGW